MLWATVAIAGTGRAATGRPNRPRKRIAIPVGTVMSAAPKRDPVAALGHALYGYLLTDSRLRTGGPLADP